MTALVYALSEFLVWLLVVALTFSAILLILVAGLLVLEGVHQSVSARLRGMANSPTPES
ncbi:MAG TPA: hypothetical protein VMU43_04075 [Candidatus Acidoferrum sp.]|nr:hypothetical protein [Candidatus Acidoferrum sp.]